tara:strand:- start:2809 stop:3303 length:495 start_codon:yes stop_codon:yes gene_type:complete
MNKTVEKLKKIHDLCINHKLTISTAESCTGGYIAKYLTDQKNSSIYFKGSIIAYSNEVKTKLLKVPYDLIDEYGAVSAQVAVSMAIGVSKIIQSDIALSVTGIMEKTDDLSEKNAQVFISIKSLNGHETFHFNLDGNRETNRQKTVYYAFNCLYDFINKHSLLS